MNTRKKYKSHSIFCCFCEDSERPRRTPRTLIDEMEKDGKAYKIDTNSVITSKEQVEKQSQVDIIQSKNETNTNKGNEVQNIGNITNKPKINNKTELTTNRSYYTNQEGNIKKLVYNQIQNEINSPSNNHRYNNSIYLPKVNFNY